MNRNWAKLPVFWMILIPCIFSVFFWTSMAQEENASTTFEESGMAKVFTNLDFERGRVLDSSGPKEWMPLHELENREADPDVVYQWDDETFHSGKHSVKITKRTDKKIAAWVQEASCGESGRRYQASAWVKTKDLLTGPRFKRGANLMVVFLRKNLDPLVYEHPFVQETQDWSRQRLAFIVPEDCVKMRLVMGLSSTKGAVWWDDVSVRAFSPVDLSAFKVTEKSQMDQYGGWKNIKGKATGFFHTEKIDNRWWVITPEGNGFIVVGLQHMFRRNKDLERLGAITSIPTNQDNIWERFSILREHIPSLAREYQVDAQQFFSDQEKENIKKLLDLGDMREGARKIDKVFKRIEGIIAGLPEQTRWAETTSQRLKDLGFNMVSHNPLFKRFAYDAKVSPSLWGFPFITPEVRVPVPSIDPGNILYNVIAFPDVFDERFEEILEHDFRETASRLKDDPWLLGYFLGNELPWGGDPDGGVSIFDMFFALSRERAGKKGVVKFLKAQYHNNTESFNKAWGTQIGDFKELLLMTGLGEGLEKARCRENRSGFLRLVARTYFEIHHRIVKKYDPNHMILGARFIGHAVPREVLETIGKYVDIVSFQPYDPIAPSEWLEESYALHGRPILVSEFSFKAQDSGLPNIFGAGSTFKTQQDRALWYERYVCRLLSSPAVVGYIWYKYADDPPRKEGEENNYGLVRYDERPYEDLVKKVKEVNHRVHFLATRGKSSAGD